MHCKKAARLSFRFGIKRQLFDLFLKVSFTRFALILGRALAGGGWGPVPQLPDAPAAPVSGWAQIPCPVALCQHNTGLPPAYKRR